MPPRQLLLLKPVWLAARKQASASRKIAAALRDDLRSAKVEQKAIQLKQKVAAAEAAAKAAVLKAEARLQAAQDADLAAAVKRFEKRWLKARAKGDVEENESC